MAGWRDPKSFPVSQIGQQSTDQLFPDPSRWAAEALGGREFFFDIGARAVHRIGLMSGLGWKLPKGEARDYIDRIDVRFQQGTGAAPLYTMTFGVAEPHEEATGFHNVVREVKDVPVFKLREVYDANT